MKPPTDLTRRTFLALAASIPVVALASPALADATSDALGAITKARAGLKSMSAKFTQVRKIGLLKNEVKSTGELTLVMPDQLRWELFAPDAIVYWVNASGIYYKSGTAPKATKAPPSAFSALLPDMIAFLGGDLAKLKSRYDLSATTEQDGSVNIVALPTDSALKAALKKISVKTNTEKWGIARVVIEEPKGDSSVIDFQANEKNPKVPPAKMTPP